MVATTKTIGYVEVSLYNGGTLVTPGTGQTSLRYTPGKVTDTRTVTLTQLKLNGVYEIKVQGFKGNGQTVGTLGSVTFNSNVAGGAYEDRPTLSATRVTL